MHDTGNSCGRNHVPAVGDFQCNGIPNTKHSFVVLERAIADQQTDQIALLFIVRATPSLHGTMIVQHDFIVGTQITRFDPLRFTRVARHTTNAQHRMVSSQPQ